MKVQKFHSQFSPNSIYRDILNGSTDLCVRLCYVSCSNTRCSPDRLTFSPGRTHVDVDVELIYGRRLVVPLCPPLKCLVRNLALNTCHVDHVRHAVMSQVHSVQVQVQVQVPRNSSSTSTSTSTSKIYKYKYKYKY